MMRFLSRLSLFLLACSLSASAPAADFQSDWDRQHDRIWIGPEYWANPLEDWRLADGRLECTSSAPGRSVHLLAHQLGEQDGTLEMSVVVGLQEGSVGDGSVGFEIGIQSELGDYRSSLIFGRGIPLTIDTEGTGVIDRATFDTAGRKSHPVQPADLLKSKTGLRIRVTMAPVEDGKHEVWIGFENPDPAGDSLGRGKFGNHTMSAAELSGNIALVVNSQPPGRRAGTPGRSTAKFWFRDLKVSGTKVVEHHDQTFGPILYSMHTLSRGTMTMTAQMPPVGIYDEQSVVLQVPTDVAQEMLGVPEVDSTADGRWAPVARATIDPLSCTAHFRVPDWPDTEDVPYRLVYSMRTRASIPDAQSIRDASTEHTWSGTVRKDPVDKPAISVAGFTGHQHTAFPNALLVSNVAKHDPDLLFFSGDQIYENAGGFGIIREPADRAALNYLRKIWLWGWSFRDVLKDRPSFVLPDDHDVYQGNIWGQGGKPVPGGIRDHAQGGFAEPADFVNAVFRTQCGHHPPAYDPTPKLQGIDCWYGDCLYGRISFAIIEDRYFKSGPEGKVNTWPGRPDHVKDPNFDTTTLDHDGLILLGERQLDFLHDWAADWHGADMKCVCSQTIFANVANYHGGNQEFIYGDLDSNGWPQTGRNKAVDAMRRGFAFHYAGDQHLPSIIQYGVDDWRDAGFSFCVPSTAAGYPRSWRPDEEGRDVRNRPPVEGNAVGLPNTGDYYDSFKNHVTVFAIANPAKKNRRPVLELLHDKSSGYGIVRFNKPEQTITMECWKLIFDADAPQPEDQFTGWPKTISLLDNYARKAAGYLPTIEVDGMANPVVQVIDEATGEIVYTLRIRGTSFRPPVFSDGPFTVRIGELDENERILEDLKPVSEGASQPLKAEFP